MSDNQRPPAEYVRETLVAVLVYHQRRNMESCCCGWSVLGASHPEHVADVYEMAALNDGEGGVA